MDLNVRSWSAAVLAAAETITIAASEIAPAARAIDGARMEGVVAVSLTHPSEINPAAEATQTSMSQSIVDALAHQYEPEYC